MALHICSIVQEALHNVAKHANARRAVVALELRRGGWEIVISDDGRGFDAGALPERDGGLGLTSMRERAVLAGGQLTVESSAGNGTTVHLRFRAVPKASEGRRTSFQRRPE